MRDRTNPRTIGARIGAHHLLHQKPNGILAVDRAPIRGACLFDREPYEAFSVSQSAKESVIASIASQAIHHRKMTFQEEFRTFLQKHGISFDERYVWD